MSIAQAAKKLLSSEEGSETAAALIGRHIPFKCEPGPHDMVFFSVEPKYAEEFKGLTSHFGMKFNTVPANQQLEKNFAASSIGTHVSTTGGQLGRRSQGVSVVLHWRPDEPLPCSAEVLDTETGGNRHYAEIGLFWDSNGSICDYDGADSWIQEVGLLIKEWDSRVDLSYVEQ